MPESLEAAAELATQLLTALRTGRFRDAAALIHPEAAQDFRDQQLDSHRRTEELAKGPPPDWGMTPEQLASFLPEMPNPFLRTIWAVADVAAFEALSPATVVERFLAFRFGDSPAAGPARDPGTILGMVSEGQEFVHVILRGSKSWRERMDWEPIAALTLKRLGDKWAALLNGELIYGSDGGFSVGLHGEARIDTDSAADAG